MKEKQETDKEKWERELNELEPEDGVFTVTEWKWTLEQREAMKKIRLKRSSERDKFMSAEPKCYTRHCKHYLGVKWYGDEEASENNYCHAFPGGIPSEIAYGNNDHSKPLPSQGNGIVFEKGPFEWEEEAEEED